MNYADIIFLVCILTGVMIGYKKGFITSSFLLINLFISTILLIMTGKDFAKMICDWLTISYNDYSFIILFSTWLLSFTLISFLFYGLNKKIPANTRQHYMNKITGIIPGAVYGWAFAYGLFYMITVPGLLDNVRKDIHTSSIAQKAINSTTRLTDKIPGQINPTYENIASATHDPVKEESSALPFKTSNFIVRKDLEQSMLQLVNAERIQHHLKPVLADTALKYVARLHSMDMFMRGYFSHNTPEGADPFQRMKEADISFRVAGENLALSPSLLKAHEELMKSPGHRANILNPEFGRLGIGVIENKEYGLMISQEFRN